MADRRTDSAGGDKVGYLLNQYPMPSQTFVRREIAALEAMGWKVLRYSIRSGEGHVIDPDDLDELDRTVVVLENGAASRLAMSVLRIAARHPVRFFSALRAAVSISRGSGRGLLVHLVYLAEACSLLECFGRDGVRHLHSHFGTNAPTVALLTQRLGGPTFSFTVHGPEEFDRPEALHLRRKVREASFVVAISSFGRSQLLRWCDPADWDKVHVVRCGLDAKFLDAALTPTPDVPRLVCVGRLSAQKGQLLLLEAVARVVGEGREVELVLAGDGELRPEIEAAVAAHGLGDVVTLAGWLDGASIRAELERSRAFVLPSFAEGLPVALMEAMALGRVVVSTTVAGIPELVDSSCGWIVPAGSVEALHEALRQVLDTPVSTLDELAAVGRAAVLEAHDVRREASVLGDLLTRWCR